MKSINLFLNMKFTSLSPNAQVISMGIVSGNPTSIHPVGIVGWNRESAIELAKTHNLNPYNHKECVILFNPTHFCSWMFSKIIIPDQVGKVKGYELSKEMQEAVDLALKLQVSKEINNTKSFYAEFDFDADRCDKSVWKNIITKLNNFPVNGTSERTDSKTEAEFSGNIKFIKEKLFKWLKQFSDYQIQFIIDSKSDHGLLTWMKFIELIGKWDHIKTTIISKAGISWNSEYPIIVKTGIPKLPKNISPVPLDLNDLISIKDSITPKQAFDLERKDLALSWHINKVNEEIKNLNKSNALCDAKLIKEIYNKLK